MTPPVVVVPEPVVTPTPIVSPAPVVSPEPATGDNSLVACIDASSDSDGDGYGWENEASCIVTSATASSNQNQNNSSEQNSSDDVDPLTNLPFCLNAITADTDGDGYGWENNTTCLVSTNPTITLGQSPVETVASPISSGFPLCETVGSDSDGDGWGWENGASCLVDQAHLCRANSTSQPQAEDCMN